MLVNTLHDTFSLKDPDLPERHMTGYRLPVNIYATDWWRGGCQMDKYLSV